MTPREKYLALGKNFLTLYKDKNQGLSEVADAYLKAYGLNYDSLNKAIEATDDETTFYEFIDQVQEGFKGIISVRQGMIGDQLLVLLH